MDAIVTAARNGKESIAGSCLYTTTFPCHSCARHIIAAGISKVYYIEPYEKSLALSLHSDSIVADSENDDSVSKVHFVHFEGVAPRKYTDFFLPRRPRKELSTGSAIFYQGKDSSKVNKKYLDSYQEIESRVARHLSDIGVPQAEVISGQ